MAGRRVRKDRDERREQILTCARQLYQSRSFEDVSASELAEAAGVSRGLLNHYFGTKRGLYLAAVEKMLRVPSVQGMAFPDGIGVRPRITLSVNWWLDRLEQNRETWLRTLDMAAPRGDADLNRLMDDAREHMVARVAEVVGVSSLMREHVQVEGALHAYGDLALRASREWLEYGRLTREETRRLLESQLIHLVERVIPDLAGRRPR
ncbi:TetR/AcrR family transcriptional regulator [Actinocorallia aurea]